ncbi:hypothetical protein DFP73DRAFT_207619 [Morchella snyderi]|nr:hypothetical protein DFP73DRAFT_207619 [Morchella snyderi]
MGLRVCRVSARLSRIVLLSFSEWPRSTGEEGWVGWRGDCHEEQSMVQSERGWTSFSPPHVFVPGVTGSRSNRASSRKIPSRGISTECILHLMGRDIGGEEAVLRILRCPAREYSWAISNETFRNERDNHEYSIAG